HQASKRPPILGLVQFGFDPKHLYVRLDTARPALDLLAEGYEFSLKFHQPDGLRFLVRHVLGRLSGLFWDRHLDGVRDRRPRWVERGPGGARVAAGTIVELALPLGDLGLRSGDPFAFFVAVYDLGELEQERHPAHRPI